MLPKTKKVTCTQKSIDAYAQFFEQMPENQSYVPDIEDLELIEEKDLPKLVPYLLYILENTRETDDNQLELRNIQAFVNDHLVVTE